MVRQDNKQGRSATNTLLAIVAVALFTLVLTTTLQTTVLANPSGATIVSNTTTFGPPTTADDRTDDGGTITTIVLDTLQQITNWKGYVGNVTGTLQLADADGFAIYDWSLDTSISGQVYASRTDALSLASIGCATPGTMGTENTFYGFSQNDPYTINATFNETAHTAFSVGTTAITANTCPSQALFVSGNRVAATDTADFQEIVLEDDANNLLFTALINQETTGFNNGLYDFQLIVPNDPDDTTTVYFFLELG